MSADQINVLIALQDKPGPSGDVGTSGTLCGCFKDANDAFTEKFKLDRYIEICFPDQGWRTAVTTILGDKVGPDNELEPQDAVQLFLKGGLI